MALAKKIFTPEEIEILKQNPNTLDVTSEIFSLTLEAKKKIVEMREKNWPESRIFRELGYDTQILGHHRMKGVLMRVKQEAESKHGLHEGYAKRRPRRLSAEEIAELQENPESYAKLKNEVIYLREEVEFLKKISQQVISGKRDK